MKPKLLMAASTGSHLRNFHLPYLRAFRERGWVVHALCGGAGEEIPFAERTVCVPFEKKITAAANFRAAAAIRRLLREERYDLVVVHTSLAAFFVRLACKGLRERPRLVNMVHGYLFDDETSAPKRRLLLQAEKLTAPETDLLLTMNAYDEALARRGKLAPRIERIPGVGLDAERLHGDGAALRETLGLAPDAFALLYAAEFSARKSQAVLIRALSHLPQRAVLILAGSGAEQAKCRALAEELGLSERVIFPGQVNNIGAWLDLADAVVSSSRSEGLPFNVMEAMALAKPIVASRVKGHTDLLTDGESGLLVPYGDAAACAAAIRRLMDDPALAARLGASAREAVQPYLLERVFPQVMAAYDSLIQVPTGSEKT